MFLRNLSTDGLTHLAGADAPMLEQFWTRSWFWALVLLIVSLPFWVSSIPPMMDLPGHMARYHIMRELPTSPLLQRYYAFDWGLMGNLGVDILVYGLKDILDVERATWLICLLTALLTALAIPVLSKTVHGSVQPTALLALPFVYAHFFHFGFLNYALSVALALLALALWIKMAESPGLKRNGLFLLIGCSIWLCHSMGWGILSVCIGMVELHRAVTNYGWKVWPVLKTTTLRVLPLAVPLALMILWRGNGDVAAGTGYEEDYIRSKLAGVMTVLRERSALLDIGTLGLMIFFSFWALREKQARLASSLFWPAAGLCMTYIVMPQIVLTSAFADQRIVHVAMMLFLLSLAWQKPEGKSAVLLACGFLALFATRMVVTTHGWARADVQVHSHLSALTKVEPGARILSFMMNNCRQEAWGIRYEYNHLTDMAVVRKNAFVNSQWAVPGAQLLRIPYNSDTKYHSDPSQYVFGEKCAAKYKPSLMNALKNFPRDRFDYVWITRTEGQNYKVPADLQLMHQDSNALLYRILPSGAADQK